MEFHLGCNLNQQGDEYKMTDEKNKVILREEVSKLGRQLGLTLTAIYKKMRGAA